MKMIKYLVFCLLAILVQSNMQVTAQCTEAKDAEMAKYMKLTKTQDEQGCSQCAMLALYFCSAKYSVKTEDVQKVGALITACKTNIRNMGQPYCCPDYLNKEPQWGIMAGNANPADPGLNSQNQHQTEAAGQNKDYRTAGDGLNKLINNPEFMQDIIKLGTEDFSLVKLDGYLSKYVPEYSNFKINPATIDLNNLYYANSEGVSTDVLADKLGSLLKLSPTQTQSMKNIFTGNTNGLINNLSKDFGNSLYERGKDKEVDYAVDYAVDFFQSKLGDGGVNSALIDIGGGLLGAFALGLTKRLEEKEALQVMLAKVETDNSIYVSGSSHTKDQEDLFIHFKANKKMPNDLSPLIGTVDYAGAIKDYSEAINLYKQNPDRAYYLYIAYLGRAKCKMQTGDYRASIVDYYFADGILDNILTEKFVDKSLKTIYPIGYYDLQNKKTFAKGKIRSSIGTLTYKDKVVVLIDRAFAKYRLADYNGAIADCKEAGITISEKNIIASGKANDYKDIVQGIIAMAQFGLGDFKSSYSSFANANLNDDLISDKDNDGIIDLLDKDKAGLAFYLDEIEGLATAEYNGIPDYFPFDIIQIKGLAAYKAGKTDEAILTYEKLVSSETDKLVYGVDKKIFTKIGGDISSVYSTLSSFYYTKGDKTKAIGLLDEAIKLNPNHLEYYFKRGTYRKEMGNTKEADSDFKIVKNPKLLTELRKSVAYFETKYTEYNAINNHAEVYSILKQALKVYSENSMFLLWMVKELKVEKNAAKALDVAALLPSNSYKAHILKSVANGYAGNVKEQEEEMFLAFDGGLAFQEANLFEINQLPFYCKLFIKYGSKTNNNFVVLNVDKEQMIKTHDSLTIALTKQYKNIKGFEKTLKIIMKASLSKSLGNIEELLEALNQKNETELSSIDALDKIECLLLLNKKEEAIKFAQKIEGKYKMEDASNDFAEQTNRPLRTIQNISRGGCN